MTAAFIIKIHGINSFGTFPTINICSGSRRCETYFCLFSKKLQPVLILTTFCVSGGYTKIWAGEVTCIQQPVYVDILITINFIVDYFLLRLTSLLTGILPSHKRFILCAVLSSLTSLMIFLPPLPPFLSIVINLLLSGGLIRIAFPWTGPRTYFSQTVVFYCVNLLFAGGIFLLSWIKAPKGLLFFNGAVYFHMSPIFLIAAAALLYGVTRLFQRSLTRGRIAWKGGTVLLKAGDIQVHMTAYMDTGNHLRDIFTGLPVVVCTAEALKPVLGEEGFRWVKERKYLSVPPPEFIEGLHFRMMPFSGIGGDGLLPVFAPDGLWMKENGKEGKTFFQAAAAITPSPFRQGYEILLHPDIWTEQRVPAQHRSYISQMQPTQQEEKETQEHNQE